MKWCATLPERIDKMQQEIMRSGEMVFQKNSPDLLISRLFVAIFSVTLVFT